MAEYGSDRHFHHREVGEKELLEFPKKRAVPKSEDRSSRRTHGEQSRFRENP
jgi:hypothetical protein